MPSPGEPSAIATADVERMRATKVPYSSRITLAADLQLKAMAREGKSQTELLAEALNLLFRKYKQPECA